MFGDSRGDKRILLCLYLLLSLQDLYCELVCVVEWRGLARSLRCAIVFFFGRTLGVSFRCRRFLVAVDPRLSFSLYSDAYDGLSGHPLRVCTPQDPEPIKGEKNAPTARG